MLVTVEKEMSRQEIQSALALRGRENFEARYLKPAIEAAFIDGEWVCMGTLRMHRNVMPRFNRKWRLTSRPLKRD
jgi:hypothetical protein